MNKILSNLNDVQRQVVTTPTQNTLVIAAPGSGKTLVLSRRIAYLIKQGTNPSSILAVTFTNKAANEMKSRIHSLIGDDIDECWIGTFHSICLRILYKYGGMVGLQPGFTIIDEKDQLKLVKKAIDDVGININEKPDFVLSKIGTYKNQLIDPQLAMERYRGAIPHIYHRYQELLYENNCMDFDEIQVRTVNLLQNYPRVREVYHNKFKHISIDELQDTCDTQFRLIQLLTADDCSLFTVSDIDQAIYGFRSANVQNVANIQSLYNSEVIKMEQNYRSTEAIITAANAVISNNDRVIDKVIWTENEPGLGIVCYSAQDEMDEANFVASVIKQTMDREHRKYSDFTILYRTNAQSRIIEETFLTRGMPYQIVGNISFFQRKEIKDMIAYMKVITNQYDSLSIERVINVPKRGIGETTIGKIDMYARAHGIPFSEALSNVQDVTTEYKISPKTVSAIGDFMTLVNSLREASENISLVELIKLLWDNTQYIDILYSDGSEDSMGRIDNLKEFYSMASNYQKKNPDCTLGEFLNSISIFTEQDAIKDTNAIKLMTVHTSKGLEFPIVFIIGLEDGTFPHFKSISNHKELEEERRLFYVALTRAEKKVYLSHSKYRSVMGQPTMFSASRFINEIPNIVNVR